MSDNFWPCQPAGTDLDVVGWHLLVLLTENPDRREKWEVVKWYPVGGTTGFWMIFGGRDRAAWSAMAVGAMGYRYVRPVVVDVDQPKPKTMVDYRVMTALRHETSRTFAREEMARPPAGVQAVQQRVRIVSDGTARGTSVLMPDGSSMSGVIKRIAWEVEAGGIANVTVTFSGVHMDAEGFVPLSMAEGEPCRTCGARLSAQKMDGTICCTDCGSPKW